MFPTSVGSIYFYVYTYPFEIQQNKTALADRSRPFLRRPCLHGNHNSCAVDVARRFVAMVMVRMSRLSAGNVVAAMVAAAPRTFCQACCAKPNFPDCAYLLGPFFFCRCWAFWNLELLWRFVTSPKYNQVVTNRLASRCQVSLLRTREPAKQSPIEDQRPPPIHRQPLS